MQLLEQAQTLLNFDGQTPFDVNILDAVINTMYRGQGDAQRQASEVLNVLRDHPDAWTKVDSILEFSKCQETKYYALQILEKTIKTRWKALPKEQCEGTLLSLGRPLLETHFSYQTIHRQSGHFPFAESGADGAGEGVFEQARRHSCPGRREALERRTCSVTLVCRS